MVYVNKSGTIAELRTNIEHEITAVSADLCLKIVKNWVQRLDFCHAKEADGIHWLPSEEKAAGRGIPGGKPSKLK